MVILELLFQRDMTVSKHLRRTRMYFLEGYIQSMDKEIEVLQGFNISGHIYDNTRDADDVVLKVHSKGNTT